MAADSAQAANLPAASAHAAPPPDWWHDFASQMHAPDWIQAGLLIVAIVALLITAGTLIYTALALKETARGRDVENYLTFLEKLNGGWRNFGAASDDHESYVAFTELMNLFEGACHLLNEKVITGTTRVMIGDYLKEMLPIVFANERAKELIKQSQTTDGTYDHIRRFARENGVAGVPHAA